MSIFVVTFKALKSLNILGNPTVYRLIWGKSGFLTCKQKLGDMSFHIQGMFCQIKLEHKSFNLLPQVSDIEHKIFHGKF